MSQDGFEPKIVAFLCNWCSYTGADLAGTARMKYPANVRNIRVMCSGRVDPPFLIAALQKGADGVMIGGCHIGDCHYQTGNYSTRRRAAIFKTMLETLGINPRRFRMEWISASEGGKYAETIRDFTKQIKELGPNPLNQGAENAR